MTAPSDALQTIETRTSLYWERPDGIIVQRAKAGVTQSLGDARDNLVEFERMTGGKKRVILVDLRAEFGTEPGVREYYADHGSARLVGAMGMLIESSFGRVVGNLFLTLSPPRFPSRMFTVEDEAILWLRRMAKGLNLQRATA